MKISDEASAAAYQVAKRVYQGHLNREKGLDLLASRHSMNRNSAGDYLNIFACMIEGRRYTRTNNAFATDYYLTHIHEDYGEDGLRNALAALALHLEYYEALRGVSLKKIRDIQSKHAALISYSAVTVFPEEVPEGEQFFEGAVTKRFVNVYERNPAARTTCVNHYGCKCFVCDFDFEGCYGEIGRLFIHVHHLVELSTINGEYVVDPINDLRPVCPNCHAMIHRKKPALSIEQLKGHLTRR